jgi:hypothetical protein
MGGAAAGMPGAFVGRKRTLVVNISPPQATGYSGQPTSNTWK